MPLFDFVCPVCEKPEERLWRQGDPTPTCPTCSQPLQRVIGAPAVHGGMARGREAAIRSLDNGQPSTPCCNHDHTTHDH